jgi:hypothetical protein
MALELEQIKLKHGLLLIEEEKPMVATHSGGVAKTQDTINAEIAKKQIYIGKVVKVIKSLKDEDEDCIDCKEGDIVCYQKQACDPFDIPINGYNNLKTIRPVYIIAIITSE